MRTVIIMIAALLLGACGTSSSCKTNPEIDQQTVSIPVHRLERELFQLSSAEEIEKLLAENPSFASYFLHASEYPHDSILAQKLHGIITNEAIDTLYREAQLAFEDLSPITEDLETLFGKMQSLFPGTGTPRLVTAVTGLYNDLFISDSLIIVGIDFFIGDGATFKPQNTPEYMLRRYDKEHLPAIIAKFMAGQKIQNGQKSTLLSEMIDFGKTYYLASRLLPCTADSLLLGYTPQEMTLIQENESVIWANFVENEILYETSHVTKRRFLGERPNVYEISQKCPGRIGAWVGWRIVEQYMERTNATIKELIAERDNEKIFMQSGYKPLSR
ncbi:gliding motility lipoprotein GldB [Marinoscillum furvescens]|uniref:Gliding motility-associated lipoprotein GldB n=1 Tax=Marinoscillum furvescens DSM 4134 TaxID=1122208 RepID=A0A3D9L4L9_MARFU|nr:gliding motility lipoprotein GldB [Marinoscillum furvescens]RED98956.1 hypothetical protein C7460_109148 [Marinoscillum furvescens DSM 4134]